jgi:hypothetical protein
MVDMNSYSNPSASERREFSPPADSSSRNPLFTKDLQLGNHSDEGWTDDGFSEESSDSLHCFRAQQHW